MRTARALPEPGTRLISLLKRQAGLLLELSLSTVRQRHLDPTANCLIIITEKMPVCGSSSRRSGLPETANAVGQSEFHQGRRVALQTGRIAGSFGKE